MIKDVWSAERASFDGDYPHHSNLDEDADDVAEFDDMSMVHVLDVVECVNWIWFFNGTIGIFWKLDVVFAMPGGEECYAASEPY